MKVTSFEISKELAEIGFEAKTDFCWYEYRNVNGSPNLILSYIGDDCDMDTKPMQPLLDENATLCFDLETILEALPKRIDINGVGCRFEMYSFADLDRNELISIGYMRARNFTALSSKNESLADTAARLWLKLKKENLI